MTCPDWAASRQTTYNDRLSYRNAPGLTRVTKRIMAVSVLFLFLLAAPAAELPRGTVIDRVETADNPQQSYALYLPSNYSPDRAWPILYCLDPMARGRVPVELFSKAAERDGVIVAGSNNSRNGPTEPVRKAIQALVTDTHARFKVDDSRVFVTGFSGGSRLALDWAQGSPLAGVIAVGAGFLNEVPKQFHTRVFAAAGVDDFNYGELYVLSRELAARGVDNRFEEFKGGHQWLPAESAEHALAYMLKRSPGLPAPDSAQTRREIERAHQLFGDLAAAEGPQRIALLEQTRQDATRKENTAARRAARRALGAYYVGSIEKGRELVSEKRYSEGARFYQQAVEARPEANWTWFDLAAARAGANDKRGAIGALSKAIEHGFRDRSRIDQEPLFEPYRKDRKFQAAVDSIPAK